MIKNIFYTPQKWLIILLSIVLFSSCVPQKQIKYLQSASESDTIPVRDFATESMESYKVQSGDNLYIQVMSMDEQTNQLFGNTQQGNTYNSEISVYLQSYTVDKNGSIDFPIVDKLNVEDLTVEEIRAKIQSLVDEYLVGATVFVKMVNFNITILGEVRRPGKFKVYQDQINIFEAVAMAGDLTDFAARSQVKLVRQTEDGYRIYNIDLTRDNIIASDFYQIMPNDILYIEPLKIKQFGFASFPYSIIFSTISATLLILNYMK
ncbi:MAG: polysaccharide biosynthesis/export family protein [Bacteroidales bacterium]|nr:polysaccharide biosynthesis/export family protein [Bacteroidales bacterium]